MPHLPALCIGSRKTCIFFLKLGGCNLECAVDDTIAYVVTLGGQKKRLGIPIRGKPSPFYSNGYACKDLALADPEHLGTTLRADALCRWLSVLHGYGLGVLHLPLGTALHTISFHTISSPVFTKTTTFTPVCQGSVELYRVRIATTPRIEQSVVQAQKEGLGNNVPQPLSVWVAETR